MGVWGYAPCLCFPVVLNQAPCYRMEYSLAIGSVGNHSLRPVPEARPEKKRNRHRRTRLLAAGGYSKLGESILFRGRPFCNLAAGFHLYLFNSCSRARTQYIWGRGKNGWNRLYPPSFHY